MKAHTFVEAKHLEIDEDVEKHKLFSSVVECKYLNLILVIRKIDTVETPKEKLNCIVNAGK